MRKPRAALIIEDDIVIAWCLREIVEDLGYRPVMVATTEHAAKLAGQSENLSLIVCDLDLGSISGTGFDVLESIDKDESIATVIHTGIDRRFVEDICKERRPKAIFLGKPAHEDQIRAAARTAGGDVACPHDLKTNYSASYP